MLRRYKSAFLTPFFVITVLAIIFALNGFFPFGNSSVSWCDMTQQVIPLLCNFKNILLGKEGFFLSLTNAGGMNFFGVFFFFLASPFSFLVIFVEKADIPLLMNIILVLKLCACSVTSAIYFEKRFANLTTSFKIILSFSYAFCGYGMMFYQNIIWLDIMYLFPILMLGIHSLTEKGKPWLLIFSLTAVVVVNFYISYMVFLFVILYFGIYALYFKNTDYSLYVKLGLSAVISLLLSAVVWIPSFAQYTSSGRKSEILDGLKDCDFFTATETCIPLLLAVSLIFAVLIALLPRLETQKPETKMSVTLFFIMCIPIFIEPVNRIWHTGDYMSFPVRYGFITIFLGLIVCGRFLNDLIAYRNGKPIYKIFTLLFSAVIGTFVVWYTKEHLETLSRYAQTLWGNEQSYHGILILFLSSLLVGTVAILFAKNKLISKKILAVALAIITLCQAYSSAMIYIVPSKDRLDMEKYTAFYELEGATEDDGFYRVNMSEKLIDANMTGAIGYNSLGHYTSLTDSNYMNAVKALGYSGYWMEIGNWGGNIISDALMAVKYCITQQENGFTLNEKPFYLGLVMPSKNPIPEEFPKTDRAKGIGDIFANMFALNKSPIICYDITYTQNCNYYKEGENHILSKKGDNSSIVYNIRVEGEQTLYFDSFNGGSNNLIEPINDSFSVYVNGSMVSQSYPSQNQNGILELGTFINEEVSVILQLNKSINCYSFGVFGFDIEEIRAAVKNSKPCDVTVKGSSINADIPKDYSGEMFISLPYNEGYTVTLDGKEIDYRRCLTGFMSIHIENGGKLKISFTPPKFIIGLLITLFGIVVLVAFCILERRINYLPNFFKKIVFAIFIAVFLIFLLVVYVMPTVLNLTS